MEKIKKRFYAERIEQISVLCNRACDMRFRPFAILPQFSILPADAFAGHCCNNRFSGFALSYAGPFCRKQIDG